MSVVAAIDKCSSYYSKIIEDGFIPEGFSEVSNKISVCPVLPDRKRHFLGIDSFLIRLKYMDGLHFGRCTTIAAFSAIFRANCQGLLDISCCCT